MISFSSIESQSALSEHKALPLMSLLANLEAKLTQNQASLHDAKEVAPLVKMTHTLLQQYTALKEEMQQTAASLKNPQNAASIASVNSRLAVLIKAISPIKKDLQEHAYMLFKEALRFSQQEKFKEALGCYSLTLLIYKTIAGDYAKQLTSVISNIGNIFFQCGHYEDAIRCYQTALFEKEIVYGKNSMELANALHHLANALIKMSRFEEALTCCQTALNYITPLEKTASNMATTLQQRGQQNALPKNHLIRINILNGMGNAFEGQNNFKKAFSCYQKAYALALNKESEQAAMLLNNMALNLTKEGKHTKALDYYKQALKVSVALFGQTHSQVALLLMNMGELVNNQGRYDEALSYFEKGLAIRQKVFGEESIQVAEIVDHIGLTFSHKNNYLAALDHHQKAIAIHSRAAGKGSVLVANSFNHIANVYFKRGEHKEALAFYQNALDIYRDKLGETSLPYASVLQNMGNLYAKQNNFKRADTLYEEAEEIIVRLHGTQGIEAADLFLNRGNLALEIRPEQAFNYYYKALAIKRRLYGSESSQVAVLMMNMGGAYAKQSKFHEAFSHLNKAYALLVKSSDNEESPSIADVFNNLGLVLCAQGHYAKALHYYQQACVIQEKIFGKNHLYFASLFMNMGQVLIEQGKYPEALSYCQKALEIEKRTHGPKGPHVAALLCNIGDILADHRVYKEAADYYSEALAAFTEESDKAIVLGSISLLEVRQGHFDEALKQAQAALRLLEKHPEHMATALNNIGSLYFEQAKYPEALRYYGEALTKYLTCYDPTHPTICKMHDRIAYTHLAMATALEEKPASKHYQAALSHYTEILTVNSTLTMQRGEELNLYDWAGHYHLLAALALAYIHHNDAAKAGELYYQEAKRSVKMPVTLRSYYSSQAIFYLAHSPMHQSKRAELYHMRARIAYQRHCYSLAISDMQKAHRLVPGTSAELQQLGKWQQAQEEENNYLDADLAARLQQCYESYYEIPLLILQNLNKGKQLSEQVKNQVMELAVNINHLLDMAYGRFVRHAIYQPNKGAERPDLYYPLSFTQSSFINELKDKQIINDPKELKAEVLQVKGPQGLNLRKELQDLGYLDEKNCVTNKLEGDATLRELGGPMVPIREELAELLRKVGIGKTVTHAQIKSLNKKIAEDPEFRPPLKERVAALLLSHGLLTHRLHLSSSQPTYRLAEEGALADLESISQLGVGQPDAKQFARYQQSIRKSIVDEVARRSHLISLEKDYPSVLAMINQEQPFSYYSNEANSQDPERWQRSWLEKIIAISNNGKHIGLTPQHIADDLAERFGTLTCQNITIYVHYIDSLFYSGSFAPLLIQVLPLKGVELLAASHQIFTLLKENGYIQKGIVIHPIAKDYLSAVKRGANEIEYGDLEKKFCEQLEKDLPDALKPCALGLTTVILRRSLQMSSLELYADSTCEFQSLFKNALTGTRDILHTLGKARKQHKDSLLSDVKSSPSVVMTFVPQEAPKKPKPTGPFYETAQAIHDEDWPYYHEWLTNTVSLHLKNHEMALVGKRYHEAAELATTTQPHLAIYYYQKALRYYGTCAKQQSTIQQLCSTLSGLYFNRGLTHAALACLDQGIQYLIGHPGKPLDEKRMYYQDELKKQTAHIDRDIYSQLEHAKQEFLHLEQLCFKQACGPTDRRTNHQIEQKYANIIIKVRHLLDQAFTRLVHALIYLPNNKWAEIHIKTTIKFYAYASLKELEDDLTKKEMINDDPSKMSLERDYPDIYQLLLDAQPFAGHEKSEWLKDMIVISNQAKHGGLTLFHSSDRVDLNPILSLCKLALKQADNIIHVIFKTKAARHKEHLEKEMKLSSQLKSTEQQQEAKEAQSTASSRLSPSSCSHSSAVSSSSSLSASVSMPDRTASSGGGLFGRSAHGPENTIAGGATITTPRPPQAPADRMATPGPAVGK